MDEEMKEALTTVANALNAMGNGQVIPAFPFQKVSEAWQKIVQALAPPEPAPESNGHSTVGELVEVE